jgi:hypothetical protein
VSNFENHLTFNELRLDKDLSSRLLRYALLSWTLRAFAGAVNMSVPAPWRK